jgi:hypothetical protein
MYCFDGRSDPESMDIKPFASPTTSRLIRLRYPPKVSPYLPPKSKVVTEKKSPSNFRIHTATVEQIATHLHLIDFKIFEKMNVATELVNNRWSKEDKATLATNVVLMTDRFNRVITG